MANPFHFSLKAHSSVLEVSIIRLMIRRNLSSWEGFAFHVIGGEVHLCWDSRAIISMYDWGSDS